MATAYMQYEADDGTTVARWHGGAYIHVGYLQDQGERGIDGGDFHAYDVINVWDYAKGEPRIPRTLDAFEARVSEWLAERDDDEQDDDDES